MGQEKYIGMDVHQATISVAVMDAQGKLIMECLLETKTATIVGFIHSGFAVQTHDSGEYRSVRGKLQRNRERMTVRGLNDNHNRDLKNLFKSAAISASTRPGPLRDFYVARVEKGMRPTMARLTLARKMAAISLTIWKKGVDFDAKQLDQQAA